MRFYNNIFLANAKENPHLNGLASYDSYPVYSEDMADTVRATPDYLKFLFPVWTKGNVYFHNGNPYKNETDFVKTQIESRARLEKKDDGYYLKLSIDNETLKQAITCGVNTGMLGQTFISETIFDNQDGSMFLFDSDFFGKKRNVEKPVPGPFELPVNQEVKIL